MLPEGAWPNWVLGNHDRPRVASRVGPAQARVAAMLLLTLRGTPTLYYGDEIGMQDVPIAPERVRDPFERRVPGLGLGRDPVRTPMQWSAEPNAGFTAGEPWLPLAASWREVNVAAQVSDPASMLSLYRKLIALRRGEAALEVGSFAPLEAPPGVLAYLRGDALLVALNLSGTPQRLVLQRGGTVVLSTRLDREGEATGGTLGLRPDEGVVVRLERKVLATPGHGHR
jgi:alpha-glucosidase